MRFRYPDKPIETTPEFFETQTPEQLSKWIAQRKYDGWRMPTFIDSASSVRCMSRSNKLMSQAYRGKLPPDLENSFLSLGLPDDTVLDCEFVGPRGSHEPAVYVFDALAWAGEWLSREPYEVRWQRCVDAIRNNRTGLIHLAETIYPSITDKGNMILNEFNMLRNEWISGGSGMDYLYEGLVVKRRSGKMLLGNSDCQKSADQYKIKFRDIADRRY